MNRCRHSNTAPSEIISFSIFEFHVKPIYATFSFLRLEHWYVLCLHSRLLHTESDSNVSSAPLLDYPSGICVVFGVIGVETRIAFGTF
jgi:hypothetical protein